MKRWLGATCLVAVSCSDRVGPARITVAEDACARCRMVIVSQSTAAQIVAPGQEPQFFDEIGCLRDYLSNRVDPLAEGTAIYVADHQTRRWLDAARAVYTRTAVATPMASGLLAHADAAARDADPAAAGGEPIPTGEILGRALRSVTP